MRWFIEKFATPIAVSLLTAALLGLWKFRRQVLNRVRSRLYSPKDSLDFTVLVAELDGDPDGKQTAHVVHALMGRRGMRIVRDGRRLESPENAVGDVAVNVERATKKGLQWCAEKSADILLWGEVVEGNKSLRLRFLPALVSMSPRARRYELEQYDFPVGFDDDLAAALNIALLTNVYLIGGARGKGLLLESVATKLKRLLEGSPPNANPKHRATMHYAFANAAAVLGEQSGDEQWLIAAVDSYSAALAATSRAERPHDWAATQAQLGTAKQELGKRQRSIPVLASALDCYDLAEQVITRDAEPSDWAAIQNNRGNTLMAIARNGGGGDTVELAIAAFRRALDVRTEAAVPADWAMTTNNLGTALEFLGERAGDAGMLIDAAACYKSALRYWTRDEAPIYWADARNALGNALGTLGQLEKSAQFLRDSIDAYRAALTVRTRAMLPNDWSGTTKNIGYSFLALFRLTDDVKYLEQAIAHYRQALEVNWLDTAPLDWGFAKSNLGSALRVLWGRTGNDAHLKESETALQEALRAFQRAGNAEYEAIARADLERTVSALAGVAGAGQP